MSTSPSELLAEAGPLLANRISQKEAAEIVLIDKIPVLAGVSQAYSTSDLMDESGCIRCLGVSGAAGGEIVLLNAINELLGGPTTTYDNPIVCAEGCQLWIHPGSYPAGLTDGANVTSWNDASGQAHTVTAPAGNEPVYRTGQIIGLPATQFVAANQDYLICNALGALAAGIDINFSLFTLIKLPLATDTAFPWAFSKAAGVPPFHFLQHTAVSPTLYCSRQCDVGGLTVDYGYDESGTILTNWALLSSVFSGDTFRCYINNFLVMNQTGLTTGRQFSSDVFRFGAYIDTPPTVFSDFYMADACFWNRALTAAELNCVMENYYNAKYNLW